MSAHRTPENIAYVNGSHSARAGHEEMTLSQFTATYSITDDRIQRCYARYLEGRVDGLRQKMR